LLHHDLVRSNLFAVPGDRTVAIDWEVIGPGPLGVDLAPLVGGSVRRGEASGDDLPALERAVLDAYISALAAVGISEAAAVDEAYRLALGLRWHVVLGTLTAFLDRQVTGIRGSRPTEPRDEGLRHMAILARHLLAASEG
jgi:thiamine kinase-like enzyme